MSSRPHVLELDGLSKSYRNPRGGQARVLDRVSLTVAAGETLALLGASGSGKSTLARLVARLESPDAGRILLDGVDVGGRRATLAYRQRVQMVFQDPFASLNPVHTVLHHLERPLIRHRRVPQSSTPAGAGVRAQALELLRLVGLEPALAIIDAFPHALSGGQRQRVAIARALAPEPALLIADEPTSMLDVSLRVGILNLLGDLVRSRGLALMLITHDLASARYLADRIAVLEGGRIVELGPAERVIAAPEHPYTGRLLEAATRRQNQPGPWPEDPDAPPIA